MFNTIKVNNTDTNYTHSIFDISEYNSGAIYANLSAALAAVPQNKQQGGMTVKFIQVTPARYSVVKTEDLETEPIGTLLSEAPYIDSGTYDENQLITVFSTLPSEIGASHAVTYYVSVTVDETTTYTSWVITKVQNSENKYVQYRLMSPLDNASTVAADFANAANWLGVDDEPVAGSDNLVKSGGVKRCISEIAEEITDITANIAKGSSISSQISITLNQEHTLIDADGNIKDWDNYDTYIINGPAIVYNNYFKLKGVFTGANTATPVIAAYNENNECIKILFYGDGVKGLHDYIVDLRDSILIGIDHLIIAIRREGSISTVSSKSLPCFYNIEQIEESMVNIEYDIEDLKSRFLKTISITTDISVSLNSHNTLIDSNGSIKSFNGYSTFIVSGPAIMYGNMFTLSNLYTGGNSLTMICAAYNSNGIGSNGFIKAIQYGDGTAGYHEFLVDLRGDDFSDVTSLVVISQTNEDHIDLKCLEYVEYYSLQEFEDEINQLDERIDSFNYENVLARKFEGYIDNSDTLYVTPIHGQSLSLGILHSAPPIHTYPIINSFMFDTGVYQVANTVNNMSSIKPLVMGEDSWCLQHLGSNRGRPYENSAWGTAEKIQDIISALTFYASIGDDGKAIAYQFDDEEEMEYLRRVLTKLKQLMPYKKIVMPCFYWIQGESDSHYDAFDRTTIESYKNALLSGLAKVQAIAEYILGQTEQVKVICYQTCRSNWSQMAPAIAQMELCRDNPLIYPSCPMFVGLKGPNDNTHLSAWGEYILGQYQGIQFSYLLKGKKNVGVMPIENSININENELTIKFIVNNPPLQFSTNWISQRGNEGFSLIKNNTNIISSVQITGIDEVKITCTETITSGCKLYYGNQNYNYGYYDRGNGGNLCDSMGEYMKCNIDSNKVDLNNYCYAFAFNL